MHRVTLEINSSIYGYIMFFIENLPKNLVNIKEDITSITLANNQAFQQKIPNDTEDKDFISVSQKSLEQIWDNKEDSIYDKFL